MMRISPQFQKWSNWIIVFGVLTSIAMMSFPTTCWGIPYYDDAQRNRPPKNRLGVALGGRFLAHWNLQRLPTTTPPTGILEVQAQYWLERRMCLYTSLGYGLLLEKSLSLGAGVKWPFLSFVGPSEAFVRSFSLALALEGVYYSTKTANFPDRYLTKGVQFRFGGSILIALGVDYIVELNMMLTDYSENIMIAPYIGFTYLLY